MEMEDYKLTIVMYNDTFIMAKWNRCGNDYSKWIGSSNWDILNKKKKKIYRYNHNKQCNNIEIEILLMTNIRHTLM